jgi:hypothetical protein
MLAGTPADGTAGIYHLTFTAAGAHGTPTVQAFTLDVAQRPVFTSTNSATFIAAVNNTFTVTASGVPTPYLSRRAHCRRA